MENKNYLQKILSLVFAFIMILTSLPGSVFAETYKSKENALVDGETKLVDVIRTTDWSLKEENLKGKNFWPLAEKQYQDEVSSVAEPLKNPLIGYGGYFVRPDGRTVIRLTLRKFDKVGTGVWHVMHMKLEDEFFDKVDWEDKETGIYKGVSKSSITGWYHDDLEYKEITPFADTAYSDSGSINVKEVNIANNKNIGSAGATNEVPINLVLKAGQSVDSFKKEPLVQIRMLADNKLRVATYTDAGTGKGNYSTYTFSSVVPLKHNYETDLLREIRESVTTDRAFRASGSSVYYNKEKGYIEVRHTYNKVGISSNKLYGRNLGYRQTVNRKFFDLLKPIDANGTIAHIFSTANNGLPTMAGTKRLDEQGNPTADGSVAVLQRNINFPEGSDLGFIQIGSPTFYREGEQGVTTNLTTNKPLDSWLDGVESLLNNGQGTTVRYYVDTDKVDKAFKENDGLQYFPFFSSIILDNENGQYKYTYKLDEDITLNAGDVIKLDYSNRFGKGDNTAAGQAGLRTMEMRIGIRGEGTEMFLGTNFKYVGPYSTLNKENGKNYEYTMQNGMNMKLKKGTEVYLFTNYPDGGDLTISFPNSKNIYKASYVKNTSPIVLDWQAAYSAGTVATTFQKPDVDEIFLGDTKISGRTYYDKAEVNIKKSQADDKFQTIIAKPGTNNKDDSRIDVVVNNIKTKGYEFDTTKPGSGKTFTMPELTRDMPLLFTNSDVEKLAGESRPPVVEQVQAKVNFDLNGEKSKENKTVIEKIAPLSKEYTVDIETGQANQAYKASGFNDDNIKVEKNKPTVEVEETIDGVAVTRKFNNVLNHDGLPYDINNADKNIAAKEKEQLKLRQMPDKNDINIPQGKRILGWTTTKLEEKEDEKGRKISIIDQFNELKDKGKIIKTLEDWAKVDDTQAPETLIFDEKSPIDKDRTVYAVYGEGINLVLHSNNTTNPKDETIIRIPLKLSDIDSTNKIIDATSSSTLNNQKDKLIIKKLPEVPVTGDQADLDKVTDTTAKLFNIPKNSFIGWTTTKYSNDENTGFAAGNNNERIGEITKGLVAKGTKRIPQKTEWLKDIKKVNNTLYIPNGYSVAIGTEDLLGKTLKNEEIKMALEEGKDIDLYANYRPYFTIDVKPSYKNIDKTPAQDQDNGHYVDTVEASKKKPTNIGLLRRTAVTPYGTPTVHQNANYYSFDGGVKKWNGTDETLTWEVPGYDELGQRLSYVSVVVPEGKEEAYKNFQAPNWAALGLKTYVRINQEGGTAIIDPAAPKNLHGTKKQPLGNPYGDPLAKSQAFSIDVDTYTSATTRAVKDASRQGTDEVTGYTIYNTITPVEFPVPKFDKVYEGDEEVKLEWGDAEKNTNITKIKLTDADGNNLVLTKQAEGKFSGDGLTAEVKTVFDKDTGKDVERLVITGLTTADKGDKELVAKYVVENAGQEQDGTEGRTTILKKPESQPVDSMVQGKNEGDNPVVKFDIPDKTLNKPQNYKYKEKNSEGTVEDKIERVKYVAQKWDKDTNKWVDVDPTGQTGTYEMTDTDKPGDKGKDAKKIVLPNTIQDGDIIRIVSKQPNSNETASTQTMDDLGAVSGKIDDPYENGKFTENRNYIKIDKKAPEIENAIAKDEEFRRFIDLTAAIKEIPEGRQVTVRVTYGPGDVVEKIITIKEPEDKKYAIEDLNRILRKATEEGKKPTIEIIAIDEVGNKNEQKVEYKETYQLGLEINSYRAGRKFVKVTADRNNSTVTIKIRKSFGEAPIQTKEVTVTTAGEFVKVTFDDGYKLQSGDILDISGKCVEGKKTYTSNPLIIDIN